MLVQTLHRRIADDVSVMHDAARDILPKDMPAVYTDRQLTLVSFLKKLNRVTEPLGLYNEINRDKALEADDVLLAGLWIPEAQLPENESAADIRILWNVHPDTRRWTVTPSRWNRMRFRFWVFIMHELIHRYQDAYRPAKQHSKTFNVVSNQRNIKVDQEHLGDFDEIEAHAFESAVELHIFWPHLSFKEALDTSLAYTGPIDQTSQHYFGVFYDAPKHPAYRAFRRKLRAWYDDMTEHPEVYATLELPKLVCT